MLRKASDPLQLLDSAVHLHIAEFPLLLHIPLSLPCAPPSIMSVQELGGGAH